ncbi:MAG: tRNA (adenosine(37)-N6)-threonylcarbamoyltransferase complex dimerization subunit type 1 TsaB [Chloroflexi bacterium]|nr:tRNA (adenosine(37)-N6)-threonylcarbamoyltransferase complex dimerization subunit type 1 TsaB [Chloroflexota bacterium]
MELIIDVSATRAAVGLSTRGKLVWESSWLTAQDHTSRLVPEILRGLAENAAAPSSLEAVIVALGPGPFNGLRVAVSVAKGLVMATGTPLIGVNTLEAEVYRCLISTTPVRPVLRTGRAGFATALFTWRDSQWTRIEDERFVEESELQEFAADDVVLCGELDEELAARLRGSVALRATLLEDHSPTRLAALALLGWQRKQARDTSSPATLQPLYVRPPHITTPKHRRL